MSEDKTPRVILCQLEEDYQRARAEGLPRTQVGKMITGYRCRECRRALVCSVFAVGVVTHEHGITLCNDCGVKFVAEFGKAGRVEEVQFLPNALEQLADKGMTVADLIGRKKPDQ